jgi:prepilin-type N-terminal cleavage/methylation domain-containing protein
MLNRTMADFRKALQRRRRAGFTILEMMVVIVIVGITGTITAGRMHALIIQNRIQRASSAVRNDLEAAFAIAARNRRPIHIEWDASKMQLDVMNRADTTGFRRTTLGMDGYGLRPSDVSFSASPIEVYPNGMASTALTITFSRGGNVKVVNMSRTGLVQIQ